MKGTVGEFPHHVVCYRIPGSPDLSDLSDREFTPPPSLKSSYAHGNCCI